MLKKGGGGGSGGHQQPQPPPQGERVVRQLEDGIKRSLGLGDQQPQIHQQQLGGHHGFLPGPPGLHHQFHGGLLGYPHHLQQQQQQQAAALRPQHRPQQPTNQDNDMSAFKKLVSFLVLLKIQLFFIKVFPGLWIRTRMNPHSICGSGSRRENSRKELFFFLFLEETYLKRSLLLRIRNKKALSDIEKNIRISKKITDPQP